MDENNFFPENNQNENPTPIDETNSVTPQNDTESVENPTVPEQPENTTQTESATGYDDFSFNPSGEPRTEPAQTGETAFANPPQNEGYSNGFNQPDYSQNSVPNSYGTGGYGYGNQQYTAGSGQKPPKKKKTGLKVFAIILAFVLVAGICFSIGYFGFNDNKTTSSKSSKSSSQTNTNTSTPNGSKSDFNVTISKNRSGNQLTYAEVAQIAGKSVVTIQVYSSDGKSSASGSGIIMSEDGYVLTNDHIYTDCVNPKLNVILHDGTEYKANFVSGDSRSDLSIIKLQNASGLAPATFGSSSNLVVGEEVMAIGTSDGYKDTVTNGIISATERRISYTSDNYSMKLLQTNAIINPGSSGGALVNMSGQVVGITSSKIVSEETEGICFAIPSDYAMDIVANMQENGTVKGRAKLGINYVELTTVSAEVNNLPKGIYVSSVASDSDLASQGLTKGDVIVKANGKDITSADVLLDLIEEANPGDQMTLEVYKGNSKSNTTLTTTLGEYVGTTNYTTSTANANDTVSYPSASNYDKGYGGYGDDWYDYFFNQFGR